MSINAINSVNFTAKRVTKNGNEYDKTNVGKYAGMGVGTAAGAGFGLHVKHVINKGMKEEGKTFEELLKGVLGDTFTSLKSRLGDAAKEAETAAENGVDEVAETTLKWAKRGFKAFPVILGAGGLLAGLGLGAIADGIINHNRAKKADKTEA